MEIIAKLKDGTDVLIESVNIEEEYITWVGYELTTGVPLEEREEFKDIESLKIRD